MRWTIWCGAVAAVVVLGYVPVQARDDKPDAKKEAKKDEDKKDGKKDEELKGKIPEAIRKKIQKNKVQFGIVLLEVTADGPATKGREKPKGEGDVILLEEGDIITHVEGKEIKSAAEYYKLLSGNEEKKLTIIDVNTGKSITDYFKPKDGRLDVKFEVITPPLG
jgi:hypothetical protein